jgi:hypothetical protein
VTTAAGPNGSASEIRSFVQLLKLPFRNERTHSRKSQMISVNPLVMVSIFYTSPFGLVTPFTNLDSIAK